MPLLSTSSPAPDKLPQDLQRQANRWADLIRDTGAAPHLVEWLRAKGSNDPIGQAAEMIGVLPDFIEAHYKYLRSKRQRNREIIRLARTLTNPEIAGRVGVSISTVKRVLRADDLGDYAKK